LGWGARAGSILPGSSPPPWLSPCSQGEGSRCANLMWPDLGRLGPLTTKGEESGTQRQHRESPAVAIAVALSQVDHPTWVKRRATHV